MDIASEYISQIHISFEKYEKLSNHYLFELSDPRTRGLPFLGTPINLMLICGAWLYFVLRAGPRYMSDRKPYQLKSVINAYNIFQVAINIYIVYECFASAWLNGYTLPCTPLEKSTIPSPDSMRVARTMYITFLLKIFDLLETIIFVLRRKNNQISFLHVYHHLGLVMIGYFILKYAPGGQSVFSTTINCIIHAIMYTYYMLSAMGPQYQPYLWWKKYLTRLQLIQFVLMMAHIGYTVLDDTCDFTMVGSAIFIPYVIGLFILFSNFYIQTYRLKKQQTKKNDDQITKKSKLDVYAKLPTVLNPCKQYNLYDDVVEMKTL